jgi:hypothetical protein
VYRPIQTFLALSAFGLLVACDEGVAPTMESIAGEYRATSVTIAVSTPGREDDVSHDMLEAGLTISLTLSAGGVVTGTMFIPAQFTISGADETHDMSGTYTLAGATVRFNQTADTFIRGLPFTVAGSVLRGTRVDAFETLSVRLSRI